MFCIIVFILVYVLMGVFCYVSVNEMTDYYNKRYSFVVALLWIFTIPSITMVAIISNYVHLKK